MGNDTVSEAFVLIADLALKGGARSIKDLPGCWERAFGDGWFVAVNGHREPTKCSEGMEVPPFEALVMRNGWPLGLLNPRGGVIAGEGAEDALCDALRAAGADAGINEPPACQRFAQKEGE